jgi:predicted metal-dependent peptidase
VLDGQLERQWFPDEAANQDERTAAIRDAIIKALGLAKMMDALKGQGRGSDAGEQTQLTTALRGLYRSPWERALQRLLESVAPGDRTFTRPSRRGADRSDVVLPGRKREGWILNVVLDTSGSMTDAIPRALGAIADFCAAVAVEQIRLVQCDSAITSDRWLSPADVADYEIAGGGGSDLSPALRHLAEDPRVTAAVVLTDGDIEFPQEAMPYDILWVLPPQASTSFHPPYGAVVAMEPN